MGHTITSLSLRTHVASQRSLVALCMPPTGLQGARSTVGKQKHLSKRICLSESTPVWLPCRQKEPPAWTTVRRRVAPHKG